MCHVENLGQADYHLVASPPIPSGRKVLSSQDHHLGRGVGASSSHVVVVSVSAHTKSGVRCWEVKIFNNTILRYRM
jgi:hypothetical protein